MKKILLQGAVLVLLFVGSWFGLSQIHWMTILRVDVFLKEAPVKLGNLYWDFFKSQEVEVLDDIILLPIESLVLAPQTWKTLKESLR